MKRRLKKPLRASEVLKKKQLKEYDKKSLEPLNQIKLSRYLQENIDFIRQILGKSDYLVVREFDIGNNSELNAAVIYLDGLTDRTVIDEYILGSLMLELQGKIPKSEMVSHEYMYMWIKDKGLTVNEVGEGKDFRRVVDSILSGDCVLLLDKVEKALLANTKGWEKRGVQEPKTESVVRGPRDGFGETLRVNTALVRRRLKDPNLRVKNVQVGERTNTDVALMYIDGLVDKDVLSEVKRRIKEIKIDGALESGYIEQYIEDHPWSPFPQIQNTERQIK
jgi:spore germination protein KA